ncbi:MAG: succinylglutamate desuccinylase/aspartoacylase family protein [SAR324 cluster bacterium]|nr:succinylglutamate desuccinylase/aspartoacylase family protein [SAR324 cluster bacterium]
MTKTRDMQINKPKVKYSLLKILTGSDLSRRRLPFMSVTSPQPGPVVWLTACMHGDEVGGLVIIQEIFKKLQNSLLKGTINAFPLLNPIGFETISRNITFSREDLNRSFPGSPDGSFGERIAHQIFSSILSTAPTLLLDLHSDWKQSIPYVLLDKKSKDIAGNVYELLKKICQKTGFFVVEDSDEIRSSLTHNLLLQNIPAVTFEMGESYIVNEKIFEYGVKSILNILCEYQMVAPTLQGLSYPTHPLVDQGKNLQYSDRPYCTKSGIIRFLARPGDRVEQGQPVLKIFNTFGKLQETITAAQTSIVLGNADSAVAYPGMRAMAFGVI